MNPDLDDVNHDETPDTPNEDRSKLIRNALARRKIEKYLEIKKLRQLLYDDLDNKSDHLAE
jgi:hypothetical protein